VGVGERRMEDEGGEGKEVIGVEASIPSPKNVPREQNERKVKKIKKVETFLIPEKSGWM